MIKIETTIKTKSQWKSDIEHEHYRDQEKKVRLFGIVLWHIKYHYNCDYDEEKSNGLGFKKQ